MTKLRIKARSRRIIEGYCIPAIPGHLLGRS